MKIAFTRPPNFDQIVAAFPDASKPGVLFAFGDTIHNPSGIGIPTALIAHEVIHGRDQKTSGGPEKWWDKYLVDVEFRYRAELAAHVAEYKAQCTADRNLNHKLLWRTAARLVAPLYHYVPPRSLNDAMRDIRESL